MLWQPSIPDSYHQLPKQELFTRIQNRRKQLGQKLLILGHHYQMDAVVQHADYTGDSLKLAQLAASVVQERADANTPVQHIIFCGVHFMAETADILTPDSVKVILPDLSAGCSMADMADYQQTVEAWEIIHTSLHNQKWQGRIIPITYVNSTAAIKAFVGQHGGACCTSSNAQQVFQWAMNGGTKPRADGENIKVLFLPDQHLGRNTSANFGINVNTNTCIYDPKKTDQGHPLGGASDKQLYNATTILWAGHCSVHMLFAPEHCAQIHEDNKDLPPNTEPVQILVHPECTKEVVDLADLAGSTEYIINTIADSPPGSRWAVGTEVHLVNRLANLHKDRGVEVKMLSDCQCLCTTMYRINQPHILWILDGLCALTPDGQPTKNNQPIEHNIIAVHPEAKKQALHALNRMLAHTASPTTTTNS
ncbi:MAG: quinolinate synthase NadA [Phycisphaerales bacterium]|nr:quinolinate synthase NadA [Phycisphaerales bacterium]